MESPLRTHGVREFHSNADALDLAVEEIRAVGYTVIGSGLSADELSVLREKCERIYRRQVEELGGEQLLQAINDADIARALVGYDDAFLPVAAHRDLVAICERMLGPKFLLMSQNAIINRHGNPHYQLTWHRDLNYQHFVSSRPLGLSALYCIDPFTAETGGTFLLPASHKMEEFPSADYVTRHEVQITAEPGAILVFDAMLYHRGGVNSSASDRFAINHIYTVPMIKQQISLPKMLGGRFSDDPFHRTFLGYDSETGDSALAWRERKLAEKGLTKEPSHAG